MSDTETIADRHVFIRKEHRCLLCLRKFPVGTRMRYWFGKYEGELNSNYECETCNAIVKLEPTDDHSYQEGEVAYRLKDNQTPEEYLLDLKLSKCSNLEKTKLSPLELV